MKKTPWQREWNNMLDDEYDFLRKTVTGKESAIGKLVADKVPDGLQEKLDTGFRKAFKLIFEKGTAYIEKTYDKEGIEQSYKQNMSMAEKRKDRNSLNLFHRKASASGAKNLLFSGVEGLGLGILGVGLPDIPLFTAMLLKGVYEVALNYGYGYESEEEKYFVLRVIQGALSQPAEIEEINASLNKYIRTREMPEDYDEEQQIGLTSETLSRELLYMKFVQTIPVVGAVGGAYDAIYMQKVLKYARVKYRRRFLVDRKLEEDAEQK